MKLSKILKFFFLTISVLSLIFISFIFYDIKGKNQSSIISQEEKLFSENQLHVVESDLSNIKTVKLKNNQNLFLNPVTNFSYISNGTTESNDKKIKPWLLQETMWY